MRHFLVQWKFTSESISNLRKNPQDRFQTSVELAESFGGSLVCMFNRNNENYDGVGIFLFKDFTAATAHSLYALASGSFEKHCCEALLSTDEYLHALNMTNSTETKYMPPSGRFISRSVSR